MDQLKLTQAALEDKRTELLKMETQLREVEDKYYSSTATIQDKQVSDLRVSESVAELSSCSFSLTHYWIFLIGLYIDAFITTWL